MSCYIYDTLYTELITGRVCAITFQFYSLVRKLYSPGSCIIAIRGKKANLTDLIAATGLVILLSGLKSLIFQPV